jgi:dGTPase
MQGIAYKDVFVSHGKVKIEIGAYNSIGIVLETFCEAVSEVIRYGHDDDKLSYRSIRVMDILEDKRSGYARFQDDFSPYQYYLSIVDYVAGMTDRYLTSIAADISGTYVPGR